MEKIKPSGLVNRNCPKSRDKSNRHHHRKQGERTHPERKESQRPKVGGIDRHVVEKSGIEMVADDKNRKTDKSGLDRENLWTKLKTYFNEGFRMFGSTFRACFPRSGKDKETAQKRGGMKERGWGDYKMKRLRWERNRKGTQKGGGGEGRVGWSCKFGGPIHNGVGGVLKKDGCIQF